MRFVHDTLPQRVSFGSGEAAANLEHEIAALGASRVMVIAAKEESNIADGITEGLPVVHRYDDVVMHVPVEVAARARAATAGTNADALVSVGGGSTTGLAKAIALTTGLPIVAVPTTYAGSEATTVWGLTRRQPQDHRHRPARTAESHRLRRRPHRYPSGPDERRVRPERARALRRRHVGAQGRPDQRRIRRRRHPAL